MGALVRRVLQYPWLAGLACLGVVVIFHSPRWWLFVNESASTVEWNRALTYLKQCEAPFRTDVEPAMRWRFFPQVLVWALGGSRSVGLAMPWLGAWALLTYLFRLARDRGLDAETSAWCTLLLGASAPVLVSTGWLGINDAWVGLGLCYVAFGQRRAGLVAACVLCPFIDERFVFGLPGALALRNFDLAKAALGQACGRVALQCALAATPFLAGRVVGIWLGKSTADDQSFFAAVVRGSVQYLWMVPLGTWMAFRFAYVPVVRRVWELFATARAAALLLTAAALVPVGVGALVASDTMRTAGILLPLCTWAVLDLAQSNDRGQVRVLAVCGLLFAATHVTYTHILPINSLPMELWRLLR